MAETEAKALSSRTSQRRREITVITSIAILLLTLFFSPYLFSNSLIYSGDFGSSDLLELNVPRRILAAQALKDGELPLWEPKLSNGLPLLAEGQSGVFNPLNLPLYAIFNPTLATDFSVMLTLAIAMLGAYWLSRQYDITPVPALLGSLAFALGGVFIFRLRHLNLIHAIAYLPLTLALLRGYALALYQRRSTSLWLAGIGTVLVLQILTGHPHMTYLSWVSAIIFIVSSLWGDEQFYAFSSPSPEQSLRTRPQIVGVAILQLFCLAIAALLICAVQLLPTYELTQLASRSQPYSWESLKEFPFTWSDLRRLVDPYSFGNPALGTYERSTTNHGVFWEVTPYIGIFPLLLTIPTLFYLKQRRFQWLWGLAVFFLLTSQGPQSYVYGIFWKFCPGFNLFRCPSRFLFPFCLIMAILSAWGCQLVLNWLQSHSYRKSAQMAAIIATILTFADLALVSYHYQLPLPSSWQDAPASLATLGTDFPKVYTPTYCNSWQECIGSRGWKRMPSLVLSHRNLLNQDIAAIWGVYQNSDSNVLDGGLAIDSYRQLQMFQLQQLLSSMDEKGTIAVNSELVASLRRQGVTHMLSYFPVRNAASEPLLAPEQRFSDPQSPKPVLYIYPLAQPLGRVHLVSEISATPPPYLGYMLQMFQSQPNGYYEAKEDETGTATIVEEKHNSLVVESQNSEPSVLVIANTFCPGWHASVDGTPTEISRINHAFQAVPLPAGNHRVVLTFAPASFIWGRNISIASLIILLIGGLIIALRSRKN